MCCFLPVHSWHSSLPFSFFDCDFFFSLALIVKPRVHSQPSPTAPVWLSHRKLGFLYSLLSHSPCMTTVCVPLSFSLYVSLCRYVSPIRVLAVCSILFCPSALVNLPLCLNFSSLFRLFSSNTHAHTLTHTHTVVRLELGSGSIRYIYLSAASSQPHLHMLWCLCVRVCVRDREREKGES